MARNIGPLVACLLLLCLRARGEPTLQTAACARAAQYSETRHGTSLLVTQNGRTVFEHYANGGQADGAWPIFSGTKSFWGIAALVAAGEGLFKLDDRVADTITEWKSDPRKSQMTIRQLLNLTDGMEGASRLHRDGIADRNTMALSVPAVASPGFAFIYGPSHLQVFGELLRRKLNGRNIFSYLQERVLGPLGITGVEVQTGRARKSTSRHRLSSLGPAMGSAR